MYSERVATLVLDGRLSMEDVMKKFDKIHDFIKYKAFGKVTIENTNKKEKGTMFLSICQRKRRLGLRLWRT